MRRSREPSFLDRARSDEFPDVNDVIWGARDAWYRDPDVMVFLADHLGFTRDEYRTWVEQPDALEAIIASTSG